MGINMNKLIEFTCINLVLMCLHHFPVKKSLHKNSPRKDMIISGGR